MLGQIEGERVNLRPYTRILYIILQNILIPILTMIGSQEEGSLHVSGTQSRQNIHVVQY